MGRRKTKKSKGGGGGKHPSPGPQGSGSEGSPAPGAGDPIGAIPEGACAAPLPGTTATQLQQDGKQKPSVNTPPKTALVATKAYQRAQIHCELSSLEAQLAAVEDLQARMAAKLSNTNNNMEVPPTAAPCTTPAASASPPNENWKPNFDKDATAQPERTSKSKKNKKSKQDKALKQQENLKEAKELKEAANVVQKVEQADVKSAAPVEQVKEECAVDNWEDIEQVEVVLETNCGKTELAVKEKVPTVKPIPVIKQSPQSEKTTEEMRKGMSPDDNVEKKIVGDCQAEKDLDEKLSKVLASEIAGYLMADYNRMVNLQVALDAQCQAAIINGKVLIDDVTSPKTLKRISYADALKSSLPPVDDDLADKDTHMSQFMKNEHVNLEGEKDVRKSRSPVPRIEVSLAGTPEGSDDDTKQQPHEVKAKVCQDDAIVEALMQDYYQINAASTCMAAEAKCSEMISMRNKGSCNKPSSSEHPVGGEGDAVHIAAFLKDDHEHIQSQKVALQAEAQCHGDISSSDEARHAEAVRRAKLIEEATMEVEYEGAEEQFLMQRETRRARPWKWVRADTAPAHIDVPETVHEPLSDAEEELDVRSTEVLTDTLTDTHEMVFQCHDMSAQTDGVSESRMSCRLEEEIAQRMAIQKYVYTLEQEVREQRQKVSDQCNITNRLENSISDNKAVVKEAKTMEHNALKYKIEDLESKLEASNNEVKSLTGQLSDRFKQVDLMPMSVHEDHMKKADGVCHDLQVKVVQLEAQCGSGLNLGFPDLSSVPACLSTLRLSESPSRESTTLTSGVLSGLSDLNSQSTPVVAPLAMQEDMDSDDEIDWTSASEYLREPSDAPVTSPVAPPLSERATGMCMSPAASPLLGQMGCRSPPRAPRILPPPAAVPAYQQPHPIQQPQQCNQSNGSSKPKSTKKRTIKNTK